MSFRPSDWISVCALFIGQRNERPSSGRAFLRRVRVRGPNVPERSVRDDDQPAQERVQRDSEAMARTVLAGILRVLRKLCLEASHAEGAFSHTKGGDRTIDDDRVAKAAEPQPEVVVH